MQNSIIQKYNLVMMANKKAIEETNTTYEQAFDKMGHNILSVSKLDELLVSDLDTQNGSISWWNSYSEIPLHLRILISDQMIQSISSIKEVLFEFAIHYNELISLWKKENDENRNLVSIENGAPRINLKPKTHDALIAEQKIDMTMKSFFESGVTVLDCLGAACIGILGLPLDLRRADFASLKSGLEKLKNPDHLAHTYFIKISEAESKSGPKNWLNYMVEFRNLLSHRARTLSVRTLSPEILSLVDPKTGENIVHTKIVYLLSQCPNSSEMEMWANGTIHTLEESAEITLKGLKESLFTFTNEVCDVLTAAWIDRKETPLSIPIPKRQWKYKFPKNENTFQGYAPGTLVFQPESITVSYRQILRMKSALVDGDRIEFWKTIVPCT
jgi:hypothetical protein